MNRQRIKNTAVRLISLINLNAPDIIIKNEIKLLKDCLEMSSKQEIEMTSNHKAEQILSTLERQKFDDWYNSGNFDKYISGEPICRPRRPGETIDDYEKYLTDEALKDPKEQILKDIVLLFQL